jgi:hypothetical protein
MKLANALGVNNRAKENKKLLVCCTEKVQIMTLPKEQINQTQRELPYWRAQLCSERFDV